MPTDKKGDKITWKEFFSRWKQGIQKVTPAQQMQANLFGYILVFAGIIWGIALSFKLKQWWLFTVLLGSFIITSTTVLGIVQKYLIIRNIERQMKMEVQDNV